MTWNRNLLSLLSALAASWASEAVACSCPLGPSFEIMSGTAIPQNGAILIQSFVGPDVSVKVGGAARGVEVEGRRGFFTATPETTSVGETMEVIVGSWIEKPISRSVTIGEAVGAEQEMSIEVLTQTERGLLTVSSSSTSCFREVDAAYVDVELSLPPELVPYRDSFFTHLAVEDDGAESWSPPCGSVLSGSPLGRHKYRVWADCGEAANWVLGTRELEMSVMLPGSQLTWEAKESVNLRCSPSGCTTGVNNSPSPSWILLAAPLAVWLRRRRITTTRNASAAGKSAGRQ